MRNFGRRLIVPAPAPAPHPGSLRPLRGGRLRGHRAARPAGPRHPHRAHLGDGGSARCTSSIQALGFSDVHLGVSGAFFVALAGSLLTAVPLTPAGLGIVELGVAGLLTVVYGVLADGGRRDHPRRPGDQRAVDHRARHHRVRLLAAAARERPAQRAARRATGAGSRRRLTGPDPAGVVSPRRRPPFSAGARYEGTGRCTYQSTGVRAPPTAPHCPALVVGLATGAVPMGDAARTGRCGIVPCTAADSRQDQRRTPSRR